MVNDVDQHTVAVLELTGVGEHVAAVGPMVVGYGQLHLVRIHQEQFLLSGILDAGAVEGVDHAVTSALTGGVEQAGIDDEGVAELDGAHDQQQEQGQNQRKLD